MTSLTVSGQLSAECIGVAFSSLHLWATSARKFEHRAHAQILVSSQKLPLPTRPAICSSRRIW
jgi:hypothetical protein